MQNWSIGLSVSVLKSVGKGMRVHGVQSKKQLFNIVKMPKVPYWERPVELQRDGCTKFNLVLVLEIEGIVRRTNEAMSYQ